MSWIDELPCPFADTAQIAAFRAGAQAGAVLLERSWEWEWGASLAAAVQHGDYPARLDEPFESAIGVAPSLAPAYRRGFCDAFARIYGWVA